MTVFTMFNTENFICEIEARPPLFDVKNKDYSNREIRSSVGLKLLQLINDWESSELTAIE